MRKAIPDALGLVGFGALSAGVYLVAGLGSALILGGALLLVGGLVAARRAAP